MAADLFGRGPTPPGKLTSGGPRASSSPSDRPRAGPRGRGIAEPVAGHRVHGPPCAREGGPLPRPGASSSPGRVRRPARARCRGGRPRRPDRPARRLGALLPVRRHRPDPGAGRARLERGVLFHVDACLGGMAAAALGAARRAGRPWDLSVPGVTVALRRHPQVRGWSFKGVSALAPPRLTPSSAASTSSTTRAGRALRLGHHRGHPSRRPDRRCVGHDQAPRDGRLPAAGRPGPAPPPAALPGRHRGHPRPAHHGRPGVRGHGDLLGRRRPRRRQRRDGRPRLAPRPPAGRPAPHAVAGPRGSGRCVPRRPGRRGRLPRRVRGVEARYGGIAE